MFSHETVIEEVSEHFTATTLPFEEGGFKRRDGGRFRLEIGDWVLQDPAQNGYAARAVYTLFATPDGKVVHHVPGCWHPDLFLREIAFAKQAKAALDAADSEEAGWAAVRALHRERIAELERLRDGEFAGVTSNYLHANPAEFLIHIHREHAGKEVPDIDHLWQRAYERLRNARPGVDASIEEFTF